MKNKKNKMILFWGLNLFIIGNLFPLNVIMAKTNQQKYIDIENIDKSFRIDSNKVQTSSFCVKIPKVIIHNATETKEMEKNKTLSTKSKNVIENKIDNNSNKTPNEKENKDFTISVSGDNKTLNNIEMEKIKVIPSTTISMKQEGKTNVVATITQDKEEWKNNELDIISVGEIVSEEIDSGVWIGACDFEIKLEGSSSFISVEAYDETKSKTETIIEEKKEEEKEIIINHLLDFGRITLNEKKSLLLEVKSKDFEHIEEIILDVSFFNKSVNKVIIVCFNEKTMEWEHIDTQTFGNANKININLIENKPVPFAQINENGVMELKSIDYANTPFEELTWKQIKILAESNDFSLYYPIGSSKTFMYAGKTYTAEVIGVNTYNEGELTFLTKELINIKQPMYNKNENISGWANSDLRQYLNKTIYDNLPEDLKKEIVPKTLNYEIYGTDINDIKFQKAIDKLWIPTQYELIGNWIREQKNENEYFNTIDKVIGEHQNVYDKFFTIQSNQDDIFIKTLDGVDSSWWTASPKLNSEIHFKVVFASGLADNISSSPTSLNNYPIGFVI